MTDWDINKLNELNKISADVDDVFLSESGIRLYYEFWSNNPYLLVDDYEDIYILADLILQMGEDPAPPRIHRPMRDLLVSAIAAYFDFYELFAHPRRKRHTYVRNHTHITYLCTFTDQLSLHGYECMVDKSWGDGLSLDRRRCEWYADPEKIPHPQWLSVVQFRRSRRFGTEAREEAWAHLGRLLKDICTNRWMELTEAMVDYSINRRMLGL